MNTLTPPLHTEMISVGLWSILLGTRLDVTFQGRQFSLPPTPSVRMTTEHMKCIHLTLEVFAQHCTPMRFIAQWTSPSLSLYFGSGFL